MLCHRSLRKEDTSHTPCMLCSVCQINTQQLVPTRPLGPRTHNCSPVRVCAPRIKAGDKHVHPPL